MNPVFVFLVLLATFILWFLLSFVFYPLGALVVRIWKDMIYNLNKEDKKENEENKEI